MTYAPLETVPQDAELLLVMPVFNEAASVRKVVLEWFEEIENWTEQFIFLAVDDGSSDQTGAILERLQRQLGSRLEVVKQTNQGHGQSCLNAYRIALERKIPYVFQIDSDGQCDPQYFFRFWRQRDKCDVIYGRRFRRDDGWRRVLASAVLKWTLRIFAGVSCVDANVPYRLIRTEILEEPVKKIPKNFFLANVALSVLLKRTKSVRHGVVPIRFRERYGGEPSVRLGKFGDKAVELVTQIRALG